MAYPVDKIRNVCLLGHGGDGKTSLAESLLFRTGGIDRLGKTADGNTVCDYDQEEIKRQISIQTALAPVEYEGNIINVIDAPGYFDFEGEVAQALRVADCGVIVVSAKGGCAVGTEKAWKALNKRELPRFFYISKIDEENADYEKCYNSLRETFGVSVTPFVIPLMENGKPAGVINLVTQKAFKAENGKTVEVPVPADQLPEIETLRGALMESVAETSEELMEKFFEGEEFTTEELLTGLKNGVHSHSVAPVVCGSAFTGVGTMQLLRTLRDFAPNPGERPSEVGADEDGNEVELKLDPNGKTVALVFKTVTDQYGRFSYFKVLSGKVTADMLMTNTRTGTTEKMGHVYVTKGKKNTELKEIGCGDIGAVSKLTDTKTGDTLCAQGINVTLKGIEFAEPCYSQAISPKVKGGEEKIASGLTRLKDEDPTFTVTNNAETHQLVISGAGDIHLDVLCSKLKNKFGVEVELSPARVPYREKIRKVYDAHGRHKKQTGGHGQFADVRIRFEPQTEQEDLIFAEEVFGGSVPRNFFPAVEKGLRDCIQKGVLAGYPMVYLKAVLYDGGYHPVDSSEMAFKTAASLAYKELVNASPVLLEPIGNLRVSIPDANMGDIMSDISSKRRGTVMGMTAEGGMQVVEAEVPIAEMSSYAIDLRSMTQGRGSFTLEFNRYSEAPAGVQQKIIEESKAAEAE